MRYEAGRCLLRERIREAGMTQQELAEKLGVRKQQINKYVQNKQKMTLQTAINISAVLRCHVEDLYEWIEVGDDE